MRRKILIISIISLLLTVLFAIVIIKSVNKKDAYSKMDITSKDFNTLFEDNNKNVIVVYRDKCYKCEEYLNDLDSIIKEYRLNIYYLNTDSLSADDYEIFKKSHIEGTPGISIIDNKEVIDVLMGSKSKQEIIDFLKKNKII